MKRIFITLLAAVMLMLSFTACSEEAIDDIIKSGEQAVSNIYLGSNEQIAEISKNLKSDDIKESMKQSNLYDLLIQVVANDSFELTMNDVTLSYSGTKCYLGNPNEYAYIKDFLTVYAIDYKKQTYGYIFVDYDGFIDEIYEISPIDIFFAYLYNSEFIESGTEVIDGVEYEYDIFTTSIPHVFLYKDGALVGQGEGVLPRPFDQSGCYFSPVSSVDFEIPEGYTKISQEDILEELSNRY